ncbi:MAG: hypothetical protein AAGA54_15595 [Myxococcota bacterium]
MAVGIVGVLVGLVLVVQGTAWLGGAHVGARRRMQGTLAAPLGLLVVLVSLLHVLVPGFFDG